MSRPTNQVGVTTGLNTNSDEGTFSAEQCYVWLDPETKSSHPIYVEGWVGYAIPSRMRLSVRQASELIGLLATALWRAS